jgi:hypothetical protein
VQQVPKIFSIRHNAHVDELLSTHDHSVRHGRWTYNNLRCWYNCTRVPVPVHQRVKITCPLITPVRQPRHHSIARAIRARLPVGTQRDPVGSSEEGKERISDQEGSQD